MIILDNPWSFLYALYRKGTIRRNSCGGFIRFKSMRGTPFPFFMVLIALVKAHPVSEASVFRGKVSFFEKGCQLKAVTLYRTYARLRVLSAF